MSRRAYCLSWVFFLGCADGFTEVVRDCPPPRFQSVIVAGQVVDASGDSLPDATVVIEAGLASSPADTIGVCTTWLNWEQPAELDASARFREKVASVSGVYLCAKARGEWEGKTSVSMQAKLEFRLDRGPSCTPDSSLDLGILDVMIGP